MKKIIDIIHDADIQHKRTYGESYVSLLDKYPKESVGSKYKIGMRVCVFVEEMQEFINGKIIDINRVMSPHEYKVKTVNGPSYWSTEIYSEDDNFF